jgi:hypothetical protein
MNYLQPRWHGSPKDVLTFGTECLKTGHWRAKIPMVLCNGIGMMADQSEGIYANESIWELISKTYETFLEHYPKSITFRTEYFRWAMNAKKWGVAREQVKLLGDLWDRYEIGDK